MILCRQTMSLCRHDIPKTKQPRQTCVFHACLRGSVVSGYSAVRLTAATRCGTGVVGLPALPPVCRSRFCRAKRLLLSIRVSVLLRLSFLLPPCCPQPSTPIDRSRPCQHRSRPISQHARECPQIAPQSPQIPTGYYPIPQPIRSILGPFWGFLRRVLIRTPSRRSARLRQTTLYPIHQSTLTDRQQRNPKPALCRQTPGYGRQSYQLVKSLYP